MNDKTIEIYYDVSAIPTTSGRTATPLEALEFRNAAMDLVETALEEADAGTWMGAEIGGGEVNFGFEVGDFDRAEEIVRRTVQGTEFDIIREIERHELTDEDMAAMAEMADQPLPLRLWCQDPARLWIGVKVFSQPP